MNKNNLKYAHGYCTVENIKLYILKGRMKKSIKSESEPDHVNAVIGKMMQDVAKVELYS